MGLLREAFTVREGGGTTGPAVQQVIDRIANIEGGDWVGDTEDARHLVLGLIDQMGYPVPFQKKIAAALQKKGES